MSASFDPNHVTKLQQLYSFITGVWGKCKSLFATKEELQEAIESIPDPLPEATSADEGKVLTVDPNGDPEWSEPPNPQVQADWSQTDSSAVDYIKNKPQNLVQDANYVHTDNNFTNADKSKLDGVEAGAEKNVNADWNAASGDAEILNKPENLVQDPSYVHTDNNYTNADKSKLDGIQAGAEANVQADWTQTNTSADDYIKNKPGDLVQDASYVHTDNNFTTTLKNKLDGIAAGAEVNVQPNWTQTNTSADDYIKNKPANIVQDASYVHTDNNFTTTLKNKLDGIAAGAEVNVQPNWTQTNTSSDDYIKNKPENLVQDASYVHTDNNFTTALKNKLNGIAAGAEVNVQSDWDQTDSSSDDFIKNKPPTKTLLAGPGINVSENANAVTISTSSDTEILYITPSNNAEVDATTIAAALNAGKLVVVKDTYSATSVELLISGYIAGDYYNFSSWADSRYVFFRVLGYTNGAWSWSSIAKKTIMPNYGSSQSGKILAVNSAGTSLEWKDAPSTTQVQADWSETDTSDPSYIQNKPQNLVQDASYVHTDNNFTTTLKNKLNGIAAGAEVNVQADWNQTDSSADDFIKNKPTIPTVPVQDVTLDGTSVLSNGVAALTSEVEILEYGSTGAWAKFTAAITAGKSVFCRVNPSGNNYRFVALSYYNVSEGTAEFNFHRATPTKNYTTQCDELFVYSLSSSGTWATTTKNVAIKYLAGNGMSQTTVANDSITFAVDNPLPASAAADSGKVLTVNSSGSPEWQTGGGGGGGTVDQTYDPTSTNAQSGTAVAGAIATVNQVPAATSADEGKVLKVDANGDPEWATGGGGGSQVQADWTQTDSSAVDYIKNKPSLATVATSGSYNDLSNKPSLATVATSGSYNDLSNKPTIPTLATLNTAGITDIRVVSSMPSNPVSTVLYLVTG